MGTTEGNVVHTGRPRCLRRSRTEELEAIGLLRHQIGARWFRPAPIALRIKCWEVLWGFAPQPQCAQFTHFARWQWPRTGEGDVARGPQLWEAASNAGGAPSCWARQLLHTTPSGSLTARGCVHGAAG